MTKPYYSGSGITIYLGDCLEVLPAIDLSDVDLVIADPPYGMKLDTDFSKMSGRQGSSDYGHVAGKTHRPIIGDGEDFDPVPVRELLSDVAEQFWFGADYYAARIPDWSDGALLVWDKRLTDSADKMFGSCFETLWSRQRRKRDILRVKWAGVFGTEKQDVKTRVHPAQKPRALISRMIQLTKTTGTIIDPYAGSGTTLHVAKQLGRRCIGVELDEGYCEIIASRLSQEVFDFGSVDTTDIHDHVPDLHTKEKSDGGFICDCGVCYRKRQEAQ